MDFYAASPSNFLNCRRCLNRNICMHIKSQPPCMDALKQISGESRQIKVDVRHPPGSAGDISKSLVLERGETSQKALKSTKKNVISLSKTHTGKGSRSFLHSFPRGAAGLDPRTRPFHGRSRAGAAGEPGAAGVKLLRQMV